MEGYSTEVVLAGLGIVGTVVGLLGWIVKRTFSHTIPRLANDFKAALTAQADVFEREMKAIRDLHIAQSIAEREERKQMREDFRQELAALGLRVDRLSDVVGELRRAV